MPVFAALLLIMSGYCAALTLDQDTAGMLDLAGEIRYLEDPDHHLDSNTVLTIPSSDWKTHDGSIFSQGYSDSTWWLKLTLANTKPEELHRLLEIGYPNLDSVRIYYLLHGKQQAITLGDTLPFDQRPIKSHKFVVPLILEGNHTTTLWLQVRSKSALQVPLTLWKADAYLKYDRTENLLQGFYYGVMIVMGIYNLFVYLAVREKNFLYYVCFVFSTPMFIASVKGFSFEYLWPNHPQWNDQAVIWSLSLTVMFGALFTESFLKLERLGHWVIVLFRAVLGLITALLIASTLLPYKYVILMLVPLAAACCALGLCFGISMWQRGGLSARYYTVGWSAFLLGGIALALNKLGVIPTNMLTENTLQLASSLEVVLLSFALAESINEDRRLRSQAQQEALEAERNVRQAREQSLHLQQQMTNELEIRVQERTRELEALNRRLAEISDTDQLTGLKNRRFLDRVLDEEITRCARYHRPLSVILLDVDHFKQFNDTYGHLIGDDCLRMVGSVLQSCTRTPIDCATRYGGEEFCLMLPETDGNGALEVAERVRNSIAAMSFMVRDKVVPVTVSLGVSSLIEREAPSVERLLKRADDALYAAKKAGRNCTMRSSAPAGPFAQNRGIH